MTQWTMPMMLFRGVFDETGSLVSVTHEGPWLPIANFSQTVLDNADPRWLRHGDGLISVFCTDETATYGITGPGEPIGVEPTLLAELLHVRPR